MAKRETLYPVRVTVNLPQALGAAVHREADREDESATRTIREAVRIGFPVLRERRRKARRAGTDGPSAARHEGNPEAGERSPDSTAPTPDDGAREGPAAMPDVPFDCEGHRAISARLRALEHAHDYRRPRQGGPRSSRT